MYEGTDDSGQWDPQVGKVIKFNRNKRIEVNRGIEHVTEITWST
jgi:hypothetical protein